MRSPAAVFGVGILHIREIRLRMIPTNHPEDNYLFELRKLRGLEREIGDDAATNITSETPNGHLFILSIPEPLSINKNTRLVHRSC